MKTLTLILIFFFAHPTWAYTTDTNYESYDQIVNRLSKRSKVDVRHARVNTLTGRSYSRAHAGIGMGQTFFDSNYPSDSQIQQQGGLMLGLAVDLLSPQFGLEGNFYNYGQHSDSKSSIRLKEFALRALYRPQISKGWYAKAGLGFSSRFLQVNEVNAQARQYRTPSMMLSMGVDAYLNSFLSVGAEFAFKTAMIHDTVDKNSADLTVRLDTHF